MMQVQINLNRSFAQPSRVFKAEKPSSAVLQFQGCRVDEKIETTMAGFLTAGLLSTVASVFSLFGMCGSSREAQDGRISNLPRTVMHSTMDLDDHLTSETVQKTYKLPEMKDMALTEKRKALMECISPVLLSIPELSDDSEETRVMVDKMQKLLQGRESYSLWFGDGKDSSAWKDAQTAACNDLIALGLDKLNDNPEAEKAIWKKLAHQLLDKNTSPEFEARYLELIDTFYEKLAQGQENRQYWQGTASNIFSVGWKSSVGFLGTAGLLSWVLSRRQKRNENSKC